MAKKQVITIDDYLLQDKQDASKGCWTLEQIMALSDKQREKLAAYVPGAVPVNDPHLEKLIQERGWRTADSLLAFRVKSNPKYSFSKQTNEEIVMSRGGAIETSLKQVKVTLPTGEVYVTPNTPIPANHAFPDKYDNVDAVAVFVSSLVETKDGKWVPTRIDKWSCFTVMKIVGLKKVANALCTILNHSDSWKSREQTERLSTTGVTALKFIRTIVSQLTEAQFDYLNTLIVVEAFGVLEKDDTDSWVYGEDEHGETLPTSFYEEKELKKHHMKFLSDYPAVFIYRGGWVPKVKIAKTDLALTSSMEAIHKKVSEFSGGDKSAPSLLASAKGYSSMPVSGVKKIAWIVSAVLGAWARGSKVDIRLTSDGDINPLWVLLSYHQNNIVTHKPALFEEINKLPVEDWFTFLTSHRNTSLNLPAHIQALVRGKHRKDAVAIGWIKDALKTKTDKKDNAPDHDANSWNVLPQDLPENFIIRCPIYGDAFFMHDEDIARSQQKKSAIETFAGKARKSTYDKVQVYAYGSARGFYGVASTVDAFLVGIENKEWVKVEMERFTKRKEWYGQVQKDLVAVYGAPFRPVVRYSPISNLFFFTRGRVNLISQLITEEGDLVQAGKVFQAVSLKKKAFTSKFGAKSVPTSTADQLPKVESARRAFVRKQKESDDDQREEKEEEEEETGDSQEDGEGEEGQEDDQVETADDEVLADLND